MDHLRKMLADREMFSVERTETERRTQELEQMRSYIHGAA